MRTTILRPETALVPLAGYALRAVATTKFKTTAVQFRFAAPFRPETLNLRALLPYVLLAGTAKLPTKRRLAVRKDALYGTTISASVAKHGTMNVVSFTLSVVNERFLPGDVRILDEALDLFADILFRPFLRLGVFRKNVVAEEIRLLKEDIESEYADKAERAMQRLTETMFADELARFRARGDYDTLSSVTPAALLEAWRSMLADDLVEATAVGAFDIAAIGEAVGRRFRFAPRTVAPVWNDLETKTVAAVRRIREENDVSQARIAMGYRSSVRAGDPLYLAALVGNALFGDADTSLLFRDVREREHLCYYVYSLHAPAKGIYFAAAGVDPGREDAAIALIDGVRERIARGDFTEADLDLARQAVVRRIRQASDSIRGLMTDYMHFDRYYGRAYDADENVALVQTVTKDAVVRVFADLVPDTFYVLGRREDPR